MRIKELSIKYEDRLDYLKHNVDNLDDYLAFNSEVFIIDNPMFDRCINKLKEILRCDNIGVLPDPDADGYSSTAVLGGVYQFKEVYHREDKVHGLDNEIVDTIIKSGVDYVLLPDSSTNDLELCKKLNGNGITTIILDHHQTDIQLEIEEYEKESDKYFIINNQFGGLNKNLTGVGVCFLAMTKIVEGGINNLSHLVSIGQVGDASDISDLQIRRLVYGGLQNGNELLNQFDIESASDLSYSIIPIINAVLRVGSIDDKKLLLDVLNGKFDNQTEIVMKRKKDRKTGKRPSVAIELPSVKVKIDELAKLKNIQKKSVNKMAEYIEDSLIENDNIGLSIVDKVEYRSTTGLVATQMVEKYNKPFLYLVDDGDFYSGSARSDSEYIKDFREWCHNSGKVELAQGHPNAFGFSISKDNLNSFIEETKNITNNDEGLEVDFLFDNYVDSYLINDIADNQSDFGGRVRNPIIGIESLEVGKNSFNQMGKVVTFYSDGVEFIWYQAPLNFINDIQYGFGDTVRIDLIGKSMVNEWRGSRKGRFSIDKMELSIEFNGNILF